MKNPLFLLAIISLWLFSPRHGWSQDSLATILRSGCAYQDSANTSSITLCPGNLVWQYAVLTSGSYQTGLGVFNGDIFLSRGFDINFCVNLGAVDGAGDEVIFMLGPGIDVPMDTCADLPQNYLPDYLDALPKFFGLRIVTQKDIPDANGTPLNFDYIEILTKDDTGYQVLKTAPASPDAANIDDGQPHSFRVRWNPAIPRIQIWFDDVFRTGVCLDLISFFDGTDSVKFSMAAATGVLPDTQGVGIKQVALNCCEPLNGCLSDADLTRGWGQVSNSGSAEWEVNSMNSAMVTHFGSGGDPAIFATTFNLINANIRCKIRVRGNLDKGLWGIVFGLTESCDAQDAYNMYLFDCASAAQSDCPGNLYIPSPGYTLSKIEGTIPPGCEPFQTEYYFWQHPEEPPIFDVLSTQWDEQHAWEFNTVYELTLIYTTSEITININGETIFSECGAFEPGRFGFYNFSQDSVDYYDFSYNMLFDLNAPSVGCQQVPVRFSIPQNCGEFGLAGAGISCAFGDGDTLLMIGDNFTNPFYHTFQYADTFNVEISLTNESGCSETISRQIIIQELQPKFLDADTTICKGDVIYQDLTIHNHPGVTYLWQNGSTAPFQTIAEPGEYVVTVHVPECPYNDTIFVSQYPELMAEVSVVNACFGQATGEIIPELNGGVPPYEYLLSPLSGLGLPFDSLLPGNYSLSVKDAVGCHLLVEAIVGETPELLLDLDTVHVSCFGKNDGALYLFPNQPGVKYAVNNYEDFQGTTLLNGFYAGAYFLVVRDAYGCIREYPFTIHEPPLLEVEILAPDTIDLGDSLLMGAFIYPIGTPGEWKWLNEGLNCTDCSLLHLFPVRNANYHVAFTDENGCLATASKTVSVRRPKEPLYLPNVFSPLPASPGVNDVYYPFAGQGVRRVRLFQIYDRWGERVYEQINFLPNDPAYGWDSIYREKPTPQGVYLVKAEVELVDGSVVPQRGNFTLLR